MNPDLTVLDADALLSAAERNERVAHAAEARRLEIAARWADLHGVLDDPERSAVLPGAERLVRLGGEGTSEVAEFAPAELAAVLAVSPESAASLIGDALDLRHRLPMLWSRVCAGEVRGWVARRVAQVSRTASFDAAAIVDRRVAPFAHSLGVGRLEKVAEAAMIEADPDAAEQAADGARDGQGVWLAREAVDGYQDIFIRTDAASAIQFDAAVGKVAAALGQLGDTDGIDVRRGKAVGVLAAPQVALDLYDDALGAPIEPRPRRTADPRPAATLYVHLTDDVLLSGRGVSRVEGVGSVVAQQACEWLGRCDVTVKPVIDLSGIAPVDSYEIPDKMREAVFLRAPLDTFPYASGCTSRGMDVDHTIPYVDPDDGGPPGQTRPGNLGPLTRSHHRIKTHAGWRVRQVGDGAYLWRSPHGRHYLVDQTGTTPVAQVSVPTPAA